jgi:uncharacterized membrane protein (DUF373 family)
MMTEGASKSGDTRVLRRVLERLVKASEIVVVTAAEFLVIVAILLAAFIIYAVFFDRIGAGLGSIGSLEELQTGVERVFAGVLLLMLGLELLKSLKSFFNEFRLQVEIIVVVAMIAVARHIMLINLEHTDASALLGFAALILALAISYALIRRTA